MNGDPIDQVLALERLEAPFGRKEASLVTHCLRSSTPALVVRAVECVARGCLDDQIPLLLEETIARGGSITNAVLQAIAGHPVFALEPRQVFSQSDHHRGARFRFPLEHLFRDEYISEMSRSLARGLQRAKVLPSAERLGLLQRLAVLPGLTNLDACALATLEGAERKLIETERAAWLAERFPRQITLNLTYRCNLNCPYCFSAGMHALLPEDMRLADAIRLVDMAADSGCRVVGLLGGEPLLVPYLPELLAAIIRKGMKATLSTNLLEYAAVAPRLQHEALGVVTVHVEKPAFYSEPQRSALLTSLRRLADQPVLTVLRYNFTDPGLRNWDFLRQMSDCLASPEISFSYTFPPETGGGHYTPLEGIRALADKIKAFVDFFNPGDAALHFAKPFPLCTLDRLEFETVNRRSELKNTCEITRNNGTNNILVRQDGRFQLCMALPEPAFPVDPRNDGLDSLARRSRAPIATLVRTPVLPECASCMLFLRGVCQAACYAYVRSGARNS
jgi:hypothetical protein